MTNSLFDKQLNNIIKEYLTPMLKPLGFQKCGNIFISQHEELSWIIDIQKSLWNNKDEAQFTLNCGVYVPGVISTYINQPEPKVPTLRHCCISARVGMLSDNKLDKWWKLYRNDDLESIDRKVGSEILERIQLNVLPFLYRFKSRQEVVSYLKEPPSPNDRNVSPQNKAQQLAYLGIMYSLLGQYDECITTLTRAEQEAIGSPVEEYIRHLQMRLNKEALST